MLPNKENICGVIVAGGKSSRFKSDKAFAEYKGIPLIQHAINALAPFCDNIIISGQADKYNTLNHKVIQDLKPDLGPIGGFHSILSSESYPFYFILSVDMPLMNERIIDVLISEYELGYDAVLAGSENNFTEPMCGLYCQSIKSNIDKAIQNKDYKLMNLIRSSNVKVIDFSDFIKTLNTNPFININKKEDFEEIQ